MDSTNNFRYFVYLNIDFVNVSELNKKDSNYLIYSFRVPMKTYVYFPVHLEHPVVTSIQDKQLIVE